MQLQVRTVLLAAAFAWPLSGRTQTTAPRVIEQHNGNITNVSVEGQLAATRELACIEIQEVSADDTPPDLLTGARRCVEAKDLDRAARLVIMALTYARFDAARVVDVSARDAGQVLVMQFGRTLDADQKTGFAKAYTAAYDDRNAHRSMCTSIATVGPPKYRPDYMILHGADLLARLVNNLPEPAGGPLVPNFDASATWNRLQDAYLHCT
jgi:hypothetical protein